MDTLLLSCYFGILSLIIINHVQADRSQLICYHCLSDDPNCDDPVDTSRLGRTTCQNYFYGYENINEYHKRAFMLVTRNNNAAQDFNLMENFQPPFVEKRQYNGKEDRMAAGRGNGRPMDPEYYDYYDRACMKIKLSGRDVTGDFVSGVVRGCYPDNPQICDEIDRKVRILSGNLMGVEYCGKCYKNYCNAASGARTSIGILIGAIFVFFCFLN